MAQPSEIESQVRFALAHMPSRNAHHEFEHICRHLTEQFICSNVLPATGPVSAGGDQGRDFETFRTYLRDELGPHGSFLGLVSEGTIAFTCTTQADGLLSKLQGDIEKICASGHPVHEIRAFTLESLSVGNRHNLELETWESHQVRLVIHDAESISSLLARPEGFWISERFLSIPSEIRPELPADDESLSPDYMERRLRWRDRGRPSPTLGDLLDLKAGLRRATFHKEARCDLPFWLGLIRQLLASAELPAQIQQRARYELAVATLRGTGDFRPVDDVVRVYLDESLAESEPARLEDASALLLYANGAVQRGLTTITPAELQRWNSALIAQTKELIACETLHRRASLQFTLGCLGLHPVLTDRDVPDLPMRAGDNEAIDEEPLISTRLDCEHLEEFSFTDDSCTHSAWTELVEGLEETPLFPLRTLGDMLQFALPLWRTRDEWRSLVDLVDEAISIRSGKDVVAARARDRAMALLSNGYHLEALEELHRAKVDWWSGDTVRGSLLAMLLMSKIYMDLRLPLAAKSHALAAAFIAWRRADDELADLLPRGILLAASADFMAGAWCGAVELFHLGLQSRLHLETDFANFDSHDEVQDAILKFSYITACSRAIDTDLAKAVRRVTHRFGFDDVIEEVLDTGRADTHDWSSFGSEHLASTPFSDLGQCNIIRFSALGMDWTVIAENDLESVRLAERFASAAQVVLAALGQEDLCLTQTQISVRIVNSRPLITPSSKRTESLPSNDGREWVVRLAPVRASDDTDPDEINTDLLTVLTEILREASLLSETAFLKVLRGAFQRGIWHKLSPARPYDELAMSFAADQETMIERGRYSILGIVVRVHTRHTTNSFGNTVLVLLTRVIRPINCLRRVMTTSQEPCA